jgi:tRNA pseudouridine55 synthase
VLRLPTVSGNASLTPISRPRRPVDGVLLLDKPSGITSNAALSLVKRSFNAEKAGHTGTLDPLASGLLPICLGSATRFAQFLLDADKRYVATVRFGVTTTTLDAEGDVVATKPLGFTRADLVAALARFTGAIRQTPPAHSALKFEGRPHYEYARRGIDVPRPEREVTIHELRLLDWQSPDAVIDVTCSKGTYVRTLASDVGDALGCGAHLRALRRTRTGGFDIANAITLDALEGMEPADRDHRLEPPAVLVSHLPRLRLAGDAARRFLHGGPVQAEAMSEGVAAVYAGERLIGVADVAAYVESPRRTIATGTDRGSNPVEK